MSIYGNLEYQLSEGVMLTESELQEMQNIFEMDLTDVVEESFYDIIEEGYNIDITKSFISNQKIIKRSIKDARKSIKEKNKDSAKKHLSEAKKAAEALRKDIEKNEGNIGSSVLGLFGATILNSYRNMFGICAELAVSIPMKNLAGAAMKSLSSLNLGKAVSLAKPVLALGAIMVPVAIYNFIKSLVILVKDVSTFIDRVNNSKDKGADLFNLYRNNMISILRDFEKTIDKLSKEVNKL